MFFVIKRQYFSRKGCDLVTIKTKMYEIHILLYAFFDIEIFPTAGVPENLSGTFFTLHFKSHYITS